MNRKRIPNCFFVNDLTDGFQKRNGLNVADGSADFDHRKVNFRLFAD